MIDVDLLKRESIIGMIQEFEREDLAFQNSGIFPVQSGVGQSFDWDIMAVERDIEEFQGRFAAAKPRALTIVGHQSARLARTFLSKHIPGGLFMDLRQPGSDARMRAAEDQIARDLLELNRAIDRQNEWLISRCLQDNLTIVVDGVSVSIPYSIPTATNVFTIGGAAAVNIAVSWENPTADIVGDLRRMKQAAARYSGRKLRHAFCGSRITSAMSKNETVKEWLSGAPAASESILKTGGLGDFLGLKWHEIDESYKDAAGNVLQYLPNNVIIFTPDPSEEWGFMRVGSDIVPSDSGDRMEEVIGRYGFADLIKNPASLAMFLGEVRLPVLRLPASVVKATPIAAAD